jgi:hypothetical protein
MKERGMICQSCHMPEVERAVAAGGPLRQGRRHLWRGGHDPDMIKRAIAVQLHAQPAEPRPGDRVTFTLRLINAGAGHKIPTGDPDRHFTVEFLVLDEHQQVREHQTDTMGRWILWQPMIVELYDNRLLPLASRDYTFRYRVPDDTKVTLKARVRYHIVTDGQHKMLERKYGLTAADPYSFVIYEREFELNESLAVALAREPEIMDRPPLDCHGKEGVRHRG